MADGKGDIGNVSLEDQMLLLIARLMEGGQDDDDTCRTLDGVTKFLSEEPSVAGPDQKITKPLHELIDVDGFETILGYLDMREAPAVRGHATLTVSAYLKASEDKGTEYLSEFFQSRIGKGTYDDFIVAFSVAARIFPLVPSISAQLFLSDGFVNGLGSLMRRKWTSKKVELACLEMLNAACMDAGCREAIQKYCTEWLEEIVKEQTRKVEELETADQQVAVDEGRVHSDRAKTLAAVILAKLQAVPSASAKGSDEYIQPVSTSMEDLAGLLANTLVLTDSEVNQNSIEGLAYASIQPKVKEKLASDTAFLKALIQALSKSPPKSPATYGGLTILVNLTNYLPTVSEEQRRMTELKAYAQASVPTLESNPLNDNEHVTKRCKAVFDAGAIPLLVTHSKNGSIASIRLGVSIIFSLSKSPKLRGQIAQQGGVKFLLHAYSVFPESDVPSLRITAHGLALILISTNPIHVFGGSNPLSLTSAIRPLLSLLNTDPTNEQRNLLPTFEALLALTNLASTEDTARNLIIHIAWPSIEELLLSNNTMTTRATIELICNLMLSPECVAKFADGSKQASHILHIVLALTDAEDLATRRAAGGALASLTEWDSAVNAILERNNGVQLLLNLCKDDEEDLRHRGVVCVLNVTSAPAKVGQWGREKVKDEGGIDALKECLKKSKSQEVLDITVKALKRLMGDHS